MVTGLAGSELWPAWGEVHQLAARERIRRIRFCNSWVMTLLAVWRNHEEPGSPRLWIATDSRISDETGKLIDEGIKLYELPVVCRRPGPSGFFDTPFYVTSIGMAGAGGSLVFQHVYGTLVPILGNLIGGGARVPAVGELALCASEIATRYVRSLGQRRPRDAARVTIVIGGDSVDKGSPQAYKLSPRVPRGGLLEFAPELLELEPPAVHFMGDRVRDAQALLSDMRKREAPGASYHRVPLNVIRAFIDDPDIPSVGGEVQIGYTTGQGFRRVASVVPDRHRPPKALRLLNSIDLDALPSVGPCSVGIEAMIAP